MAVIRRTSAQSLGALEQLAGVGERLRPCVAFCACGIMTGGLHEKARVVERRRELVMAGDE